MPPTQVTVLISSAGRRVQLIRCFREDAAKLGLQLVILAADSNPAMSAACHVADIAVKVPQCNAPSFVPAMLAICREHGVDLVVPTIDPELHIWATAKELFSAIGARVLVPSVPVVTLAADKLLTSRTLNRFGVTTPHTIWHEEYVKNPETVTWPVIIKPNFGSSSDGVRRPNTLAEATVVGRWGLITQEQWTGREFTVNAFYDVQGRLRCAVPHERIEVRGGEVSKGVTSRMAALEKVAAVLPEVLPGITGPLCYQAIVTNSGEHAVFEINARFGGGYPLAHRAGARFTQWLLEEVGGLEVTANNGWNAGVMMLRYDEAIFIDG